MASTSPRCCSPVTTRGRAVAARPGPRRTAQRRPDLLTPGRAGRRPARRTRPAARRARRRGGAAHAAARLLGHGGAGQRPALDPAADRDARRRRAGTSGCWRPGCSRVGEPPGRLGPWRACGERRRLGDRPADGGRPTSAAAAIGRRLLEHIEARRRRDDDVVELFTGAGSADNLRMYKRGGLPARVASRSSAATALRPGRRAPRQAATLTADRAARFLCACRLWQTWGRRHASGARLPSPSTVRTALSATGERPARRADAPQTSNT